MTDTDPAMERARARAHELRDYYRHLLIYVLVCALLVVIDLVDGTEGGDTLIGLNWAFWPIVGWGIAVLIHTISVVFSFDGWEERKARRLYERERNRGVPHA
jgi:Mn2+/Fe2+ NRAMP family transporter